MIRFKIIIALLILGLSGGSVLYVRYLQSRIETITIQRDQNAQQLQSCVKQHNINKEVTNDYQNKIDALNRRVRDIKRVQSAHCVPIAACRPDDKAAAGHADRDGVLASELFEYAGRCEAIRLQLLGLQGYIEKIQN